MNETVRSRWTQRDEAMLAELVERKTRITAENMGPVNLCMTHLERWVLAEFDSGVDGRFYPRLAEWLVRNADSVRDALEPFVSKVGVAK